MTLRSPTLDVEGRGWPYRDQTRFVDVNGARVCAVVVGAGPVVLLLHGTGASSHSLRALVPLLSDRFTVVLFDMPGQGFSVADDDFEATPRSVARVFSDALMALELASPHIVVGHSAGAAVAWRFAADAVDDPVDVVVGISAALLPLTGVAGAFMRITARVLSATELSARFIAWHARRPGSVERLVKSTGSRLEPDGVAFYRVLAGNAGHVAGVLRMLATWQLEALQDQAVPEDLQVLLIAGAHDAAVPVAAQRRLHAQLVRARGKAALHVIAGVGHLVHEEEPAAVARLIHAAADDAGIDGATTERGRPTAGPSRTTERGKPARTRSGRAPHRGESA